MSLRRDILHSARSTLQHDSLPLRDEFDPGIQSRVVLEVASDGEHEGHKRVGKPQAQGRASQPMVHQRASMAPSHVKSTVLSTLLCEDLSLWGVPTLCQVQSPLLGRIVGATPQGLRRDTESAAAECPADWVHLQ